MSAPLLSYTATQEGFYFKLEGQSQALKLSKPEGQVFLTGEYYKLLDQVFFMILTLFTF